MSGTLYDSRTWCLIISGGHAQACLDHINRLIYFVSWGNWDPTDKEFASLNSYIQDLLPTFPKETTICIWFTQSLTVCNSTTVLQEAQML